MFRGYDDDDEEYGGFRQEIEDELYRDPAEESSALQGFGGSAGPRGSGSAGVGAWCALDREQPGGEARSLRKHSDYSPATIVGAPVLGNRDDQDNSGESVDSDIEERLWSSVAFSLDSTPAKSLPQPLIPKEPPVTAGSSAEAGFIPRRRVDKKGTSGGEDGDTILLSCSEEEAQQKRGAKLLSDSEDEESKYRLSRRRCISPATSRSARLLETEASRLSSPNSPASSADEELWEHRGGRNMSEMSTSVNGIDTENKTLGCTHSDVYKELAVTKVIDLDEVAAPEGVVVNADAFEELETNEGYGRYFMPKKEETTCARCKQQGHVMQKCRTPMCWNCGEIGHVDRTCPNFIVMICRNCNRRGHRPEDCKERRTSRPLDCARCGSKLHRSDECHLMWRIYVESAVVPDAGEIEKWCYNCAERGHYGDHCREPRNREYSSSGRVESGFSDRHISKRRRGEDSRPLPGEDARRTQETREQAMRIEIDQFRERHSEGYRRRYPETPARSRFEDRDGRSRDDSGVKRRDGLDKDLKADQNGREGERGHEPFRRAEDRKLPPYGGRYSDGRRAFYCDEDSVPSSRARKEQHEGDRGEPLPPAIAEPRNVLPDYAAQVPQLAPLRQAIPLPAYPVPQPAKNFAAPGPLFSGGYSRR